MESNFEKAADQVLHTPEGQRLLGKKDVLGRIAASPDGQRVKAMMEQDGKLAKAMETGDTAALRDAISGILKTEEGARLAAQLGGLMKK